MLVVRVILGWSVRGNRHYPSALIHAGFGYRSRTAGQAAPSIRGLFMIFVAAFGWMVVLTSIMPLTRKEAGSELQ